MKFTCITLVIINMLVFSEFYETCDYEPNNTHE